MNDLQIFKNIQKHIRLSDAELAFLKSTVVVKDIAKNELVQVQDDICSKIFFVESGSLRAYHIDDQGKEYTIMFGIEDWWVTDMNSFVNAQPALLNIEALEQSRIIKIDSKQLEIIYRKIPNFERYFRILFQNAYIREQERVFENITYSTEVRYHRFIIKYPAITEKVTQKQIASYLGVTPEFLSTIKKSKQS